MIDETMFRPQALDSLRQPEQIGYAMELVRPPYRLVLLAIAAAIIAAIAAAAMIQVPITATAGGIILHASATLENTIVAQHDGQVVALQVKPGEIVAAGQVVALLAQPALENDLRLARDEAAATARRLVDIRALQQLSIDTLAPLHDHLASEAADSISRLNARQDELARLVADNASLRARGLITVDRYLQLRASLADAQDAIATKKAALLNLQVDWAEKTNQFAREIKDLEEKSAQSGRQVQRLEAQLAAASSIRATQPGRVAEIKVALGDLVRFNSPVIGVMPAGDTLGGDADPLLAIALVPATEGKKIHPGQRAFVDPASVRRDVYGQIRGSVATISPTAATPELLRNLLRNEELVRKAGESGPVFVATIALQRNPDTPSGYAWSSSSGPDLQLSPGTPLRLEIETDRVTILGLLMPALRQLLHAELHH